MKDGRERHSRHKHLIDENLVKEVKKSIGKHRYYYFKGNKTFKKKMLGKIKKRFKILDYPKEINRKYEIKGKILNQTQLRDDY